MADDPGDYAYTPPGQATAYTPPDAGAQSARWGAVASGAAEMKSRVKQKVGDFRQWVDQTPHHEVQAELQRRIDDPNRSRLQRAFLSRLKAQHAERGE